MADFSVWALLAACIANIFAAFRSNENKKLMDTEGLAVRAPPSFGAGPAAHGSTAHAPPPTRGRPPHTPPPPPPPPAANAAPAR